MSNQPHTPQGKPHPLQRKGLVYTVYFVLRLLVILMLVGAALNRSYENVLLCVLTLLLFMLPSAFERRLRIDLPDTLEIIILLFIFAAEILGEIQDYYITFPYWDTMLHTINGFLCAAIGFALVDILNRTERISLSLSPFYMAVVAFCFSMTVGVLWEFFEFSMDYFLHFDMQKDTILHTISTVNLDPNHGTTAVVVVYRGGDLLRHRLFLRQGPGPQPLCPPIHPPGAPGRNLLPGGIIHEPLVHTSLGI